MKKCWYTFFVFMFTLLLITGCASMRSDSIYDTSIEESTRVSFIEALVYPDRFQGETVTVHGIIRIQNGIYFLYQSVIAAQYPNKKECIKLGDLSKNDEIDLRKIESYEMQDVSVSGILEKGEDGYLCCFGQVNCIIKSEVVFQRSLDNQSI